MSDHRYRRALDWLFEFADPERGVGWNPRAAPDEAWKLGRTRALLDLAGGPDRGLRCVLVAGTKGKGSTAAMLEAIARAAGQRTGLYTQPHLDSYRERVQLDGRPIDAESFSSIVERLRPLVDELAARHPTAGLPTTFELTTVLALLCFARSDVELAILEVGLGGRLDATNAVEPALAVITTIGLDHTQILGASIEEIAREKAGIIRPGGSVIAARQRPAARRAIVERSRELRARCRFVGPLAPAPATGTLWARLGRSGRFQVRLAMLGAHQRLNAAVALAAAVELAAGGPTLTPGAVRTGLAAARLPGRVDVVSGHPTWVLDAAHNADSAVALARALAELRLGRPRRLVLGILRDKDAQAVVRPLLSLFDGVIACAPAHPRALAADALADVCRRAGATVVATAPDVATALERARLSAGSDGTVVATGSFAVVAEARQALGLAVHPD